MELIRPSYAHCSTHPQGLCTFVKKAWCGLAATNHLHDSLLEFVQGYPSLVIRAMHLLYRKAFIENGGKPRYIVWNKLAC
jgi:hypothetical protein